MNNNFKENPYLEEILREMCLRVGANFDKLDFKSSDWFTKYSWTEDEEEDFKLWLNQYFYDNAEAREEIMPRVAKDIEVIDMANSEFLLRFGWKLE